MCFVMKTREFGFQEKKSFIFLEPPKILSRVFKVMKATNDRKSKDFFGPIKLHFGTSQTVLS